MTTLKLAFLATTLAAAGLLAAGCGDDDEGTTSAGATSTTTGATTTAGAGTGGGEGGAGSGTGGAGGGTGGTGAGQGGAGGGTGGSASGTGGTGGGGALSCETYCDAIMANCAGENAQYSTKEACLGSCEAFPPGAEGDTMGNTLGCRIYHAGAAAGDPGTHCVHAGPGGAGACGANCESFCLIAASACTGANQQYADANACTAECAGFPDTEKYDASDAAGDTLACRLYHLTVAASSDEAAAMHCPHIVEASPVCL